MDMRGSLLSLMALCVLTAGERPRLVGLKRIAVVVAADPLGDLDTGRLRAAVEARLRDAGIHIDAKARSRLNVTIGVSDIRTGKGEALGYAYSIHVGMSQQVYLANNPSIMTNAVTWEGVWLGIASPGDLGAKCAQSIDKRLNEFVAVYQAGLEDDAAASRATARR